MVELYLGREYKTFYYKCYPKTKEECFCFVDGDYDCICEELSNSKGNKYPLGYLLSKCVQFYEQLRIEPIGKMRETYIKNNMDLEEMKNKIVEYHRGIPYDENKEIMFYVNRRKQIFESVFPKTKFEDNIYRYDNTKKYDCLELFSFFLLNDIYETEELIFEYQKERIISSTIIFDFIERCITEDYEFCSYENLCITAMNNQDNLDNGYTSFENKGIYHDLNNVYQNTENISKENELYHLYKVGNLKSFLYATLQEILKGNNYVIKRCKYCKNIFVPLKAKSSIYCNYRKYEQCQKTCYELHNRGIVMFKEKYDRCEKVKKQIRDRLNKWVEYNNTTNESEYERRTKIKNSIYALIKNLKNAIADEDQYYAYLIKIKNTNIKNENEFHKLKIEMENVLAQYRK